MFSPTWSSRPDLFSCTRTLFTEYYLSRGGGNVAPLPMYLPYLALSLHRAHPTQFPFQSSWPVAAVEAADAPLISPPAISHRALNPEAKTVLTVCLYITAPALTPISLGEKHTVWYYTQGPGASDLVRSRVFYGRGPGSAALYVDLDEFDWRVLFLGDGAFTPANYLRSWVLHSDVCDALIGPGYSFAALAMSPLVESSKTAWLDPLATLPALSDKTEHPAFSRMYMGGYYLARVVVTFFKALGWRDTNIVAIDDPFAAALTSELRAGMAEVNGTVPMVRLLTGSAADSFPAIMQAIDDSSSSRVIILIGFPSANMVGAVNHIKEKKYDERYVFIFPYTCPLIGSPLKYHTLRSAFCVFQTYDHPLAENFGASYMARNMSEDTAIVASHTKTQPVNVSAFGLSQIIGHDGTVHAMRALAYSKRAGITPVAALRSIDTEGFTGRIRLNAVGDRMSGLHEVRNALGDERDVSVALVDASFNIRFRHPDLSPTPNNAVPDLVLLGQVHRSGEPIPTSVLFRPSPPTSDTMSTALLIVIIVGACVGGVLIVTAAIVGGILFFGPSNARDNSNAPTNTEDPFAIVFTDIQASTALWARVPEQMSEAVDVHHATLRRLIARHHGYEVKTIGDSFMIAFHGAKGAVEFAMDTQRRLNDATWPPEIDSVYRALVPATEDADVSKSDPLWHGLRVRIGVHYGLGKIQEDHVTKGYDYYGTVVNTAARVEAVGHGGQTIVTADAWREARPNRRATATTLGPQRLRGLTAPIALVQLLPTPLAARRFPPLRLDIDVAPAPDAGHGPESSPTLDGGVSVPSAASSPRAGVTVGAFEAEVASIAPGVVARRVLPTHDVAALRSGGPDLPAEPTGDAPSPALRPESSGATAPLVPRDVERVKLAAVFLRKMLTVVPFSDRQRAVARYAKSWHTKVTTAGEIRTRRGSVYSGGSTSRGGEHSQIAEARTLMAVVERIWLTLEPMNH